MSSHRAVLTSPEQLWRTQIKLQPCSVQAPTGLCGGWGEKFYRINNQYLWLQIKLTPEASDEGALLYVPWLAIFLGCVPSPQPLCQVHRSGSQGNEKLHKESILQQTYCTSMSKLLILFVKRLFHSSSRQQFLQGSWQGCKRLDAASPPTRSPEKQSVKSMLYYWNM